jgi:hypothetical protein
MASSGCFRSTTAHVLIHCFRYYIRWSRVTRRLPENYPVKRILQQLVDGVHRLAHRRHTNMNCHNSAVICCNPQDGPIVRVYTHSVNGEKVHHAH